MDRDVQDQDKGTAACEHCATVIVTIPPDVVDESATALVPEIVRDVLLQMTYQLVVIRSMLNE